MIKKNIYDLIITASATNKQELLFVYGHGDTGKIFLWKTIISSLRSQGKIALAVASSGIASLLLPAGRTAHSRFKLPLDLTDERCFETLDKTLRDLMDAPGLLFGLKTVVLGGDFRQTLPVKKGAAKEELIAASIAKSYLWWHFRICTLKENKRLLTWSATTRLSRLIDFIYDDTILRTRTARSLQEKVIVHPKNATADDVNAKILSNIEGKSIMYLSNGEAIPMGRETIETELLYPMEYLNAITFPGFPPYELELK
ncbi:DNA helicase, partial [Tanacetum coccineum]